ncbi:hypothetical protein UPYG_G00241690 [Umbra pygmaea]|uniref:Uncharacterized protein n=1 Tax=Umbra pygmaea TaxID=75934 RepID=A0ABD0X3B0_UMBPY
MLNPLQFTDCTNTSAEDANLIVLYFSFAFYHLKKRALCCSFSFRPSLRHTLPKSSSRRHFRTHSFAVTAKSVTRE